MKRKLQQKGQMLIDKEKQLTELKAEKWEKDKEQRQKISAIQKESMERLKLIQVKEIYLNFKLNSRLIGKCCCWSIL